MGKFSVVFKENFWKKVKLFFECRFFRGTNETINNNLNKRGESRNGEQEHKKPSERKKSKEREEKKRRPYPRTPRTDEKFKDGSTERMVYRAKIRPDKIGNLIVSQETDKTECRKREEEKIERGDSAWKSSLNMEPKSKCPKQ